MSALANIHTGRYNGTVRGALADMYMYMYMYVYMCTHLYFVRFGFCVCGAFANDAFCGVEQVQVSIYQCLGWSFGISIPRGTGISSV